MAVLDHIELPNGITYDISDASARKLDNNDFDTINVTELNAGDVIVTGAARFLNTINGDISGNAETATSATKATQDESGNNIKSTYANAISISDHTITLKNKNGTSLGTVTVPDNNTTYTVATGTANGKIKVTPSSGSAYEVSVYGLKSAAYKDVTDSYSATGTDPVSGKAVAAAIDGLPSPMVFRGSLGTGGTITALPVDGTAKVGDTYKVITAGTYASKAAKVGDTFICLTKTSSANTWELIPSGDEPSGTVTSVAISNGGGLSVSGSPITSSGTITISHADTSSQASVDNSGRTYIQDISLDTYGHVTKITSATETVVNTDRYVNSAAFADATSADANNPVKMTLTRAGSDTASVTAYLPKVSSSSAGVAPKGAAVSSQSQSTKFLREDGTWATPSYTTNTNTTYTIGTSGNNVTLTPSSGSVQSITVPYATSAGSAETAASASSVAWGNVTGKPSTFAPSAHDHSQIVTVGDRRSTATKPNDYANKLIFQGLKTQGYIDNPGGTSGYSYLIGLRGWSDSSGGNSHELAFNDSGIYWRHGATTTWGSWAKLFTTSDTYSGTLTSSQVTTALGYTPPSSDTKNTAGSTDTSSKIFLIGATSQAANPQTYSDDQVYVTNGTLQANNVSATTNITGVTLGVNTTSGAVGGICLYGGATNTTSYGIAMRTTDNSGKHGDVQGDWGAYFYMAGATNRGWVFRNAGVGNVASISNRGHIVTNGSLTLGGNETNTSGVRQVYNEATKSLDFVFVA